MSELDRPKGQLERWYTEGFKDEPKEPPPPEFPRPRRYLSASPAIFRLRRTGTEDFKQLKGVIYKLDPKDRETITLHGSHQAITFDSPPPHDFFENWEIVSVVELWS